MFPLTHSFVIGSELGDPEYFQGFDGSFEKTYLSSHPLHHIPSHSFIALSFILPSPLNLASASNDEEDLNDYLHIFRHSSNILLPQTSVLSSTDQSHEHTEHDRIDTTVNLSIKAWSNSVGFNEIVQHSSTHLFHKVG